MDAQYFRKDIFGISMLKKTEKKWGTPVHLQLAFIKMESDFDWLAKPKRLKLFKAIPYKRPSSSFGYSQAVKGTWEQYKKENNKPFLDFLKDATDVEKGWWKEGGCKVDDRVYEGVGHTFSEGMRRDTIVFVRAFLEGEEKKGGPKL